MNLDQLLALLALLGGLYAAFKGVQVPNSVYVALGVATALLAALVLI